MRVAIFGRANTGKTTLAHTMERGLTLKLKRLAAPIKEYAYSLGADLGDLYGPSIGRNAEIYPGISLRVMLQAIGSATRALDPDAFVRATDSWGDGWVCDDGRYVNEMEYMSERGVYIVHIESAEPNDSAHESEECDFSSVRGRINATVSAKPSPLAVTELLRDIAEYHHAT